MTNVQQKYNDADFIHPPHGFCPGCGVAVALRLFLKVMGDRVLFVMPPGCSAPSVEFPSHSVKGPNGPIDVIHCPFGSTATFASGIKSAFEARGDSETAVVAWAGDGATFDIGLSGVSATAERNEDIIYVCYDNEAYMNTGNQRSGGSPLGARTTTNVPPAVKPENKKDMMWLIMGHDIAYAATATVGYPDDLIRKVRKAKEKRGFRFFHILTPCVPGWGYRPELTMEVSRLAVQTKVFPLLEMEDGKLTMNKRPAEKELQAYLKVQTRFEFLGQEHLAALKSQVERRWHRLSRLAEA